MKPFLDVEKNRVAYHKASDQNTVHRSSLMVPRYAQAKSNISFLNHFLIKRNIKEVTVKVTAMNSQGNQVGSISMVIDQPRVYSFNLEELFEDASDILQYLVEFYSTKNLFIPFPAVMVNHVGVDFTNCVHSFNRVLNDVFENDAVNKHQVYESSIDCVVDDRYDTFFSLATGPFRVDGKMQVLLSDSKNTQGKVLPIDIARLSHLDFFVSGLFPNTSDGENDVLTLKVLQPKQDLFYGRMLAGVINRDTSAFTANHSYYDSS